MPGAYHSSFNDVECQKFCGISMLPIKTSVKGPAPSTNEDDIIDETLKLFKANVLFRNYEILGDADRTLIYLTLYTSECLMKCLNIKSKGEAVKALYTLSLENFKVPGDSGFALGGFVKPPQSRQESDLFRQYFTQARQELGIRLAELAYNADGTQNKFWFCFAKKKFMNMKL
eukprot:GCRY01000554.1.p1 GENE.GCRY01000554.1~~GCRY01000554.1.p1  ORF type:complete len:173 (+),score=24.77 GCRY01000554.1:180-698(+)